MHANLLQGRNIRLRAYDRDDLETARSYINDPEVMANLQPGTLFPLRKEDETSWYESRLKDQSGSYSFAIETLPDHNYIGGCGFNSVDAKSRVGTLGLFLGKTHWGKGYGTEAMRVIVRFGFLEMNLNKVKLSVFAFNERALKCYERVGFQTEGRLRQELYRNGQNHDVLIMSQLRSEWEESSPNTR